MKSKFLILIGFLAILSDLHGQVDTCFTKQEIVSIFENKKQLMDEINRLNLIDINQQKMIAEYMAQVKQDSITIEIYKQTQDELLRLNEHYKNGLKNVTRDEKWYQTRFVAYLGGMSAALIGAIGIRLASK